jgi:hypothetical protein
MAAVSSTIKTLLNKMNATAFKVGLGDILYGTSHKVIACGDFTTAGGDANESITVSGLTSSDFVVVSLKTKGATPRTILTASPGTDAIAVVMSGDPSTDHVITYVALRAL